MRARVGGNINLLGGMQDWYRALQMQQVCSAASGDL